MLKFKQYENTNNAIFLYFEKTLILETKNK